MVSSGEVDIWLLLETRDADAQVAELQAKIDRQKEEWKKTRIRIISEMRDVAQGINLLFQGIRLMYQIAGEAIDPIFSALMSMISAVVALGLATATAIVVGSLGILTVIGLALQAAMIGYSLAQTIKLIEKRIEIQSKLRARGARVYKVDTSKLSGIGSAGGIV